ncbi:MAG: diguanylate cyclase [Phormidesmis sp.]
MRVSDGRVSFSTESLWRWLQRQPKPVLVGSTLLFCLVSGVALELMAEYYRSAFQVQSWDPASGLYVALLFGFGLCYAPVLFFVTLIKNLLWSLGGESVGLSGIAAGIYLCLGYCIASFLLLYRIKIDPGLHQLRDVLWFGSVFAAASLVMSGLHTTTLALMDQMAWSDWLQNFSLDWAGEITGIMVLAPPLLILMRVLPWSDQHLTLQAPAPTLSFTLSRKVILEWIGTIAASVLFTWLAFGGIQGKSLDYSYLMFVPIIWMAARRGFEQTMIVTFLVNILAVVFVGASSSSDPLALQFGLVTVTFTGVLLGAYVKENITEITRRQKLEGELSYKATHDSLTGLYNRAWLWETLESAIKTAENDRTYRFALLLLDLDRFKGINDSLGHLAGDRLLKAVSQRIVGAVPEGTKVARFGGDEFVVLLDCLVSFDEAIQTGQHLCRALSLAYPIIGYETFTTTSIGIVLSALPYERPEDMLRDADIALYEAKRSGKDQSVVFNRQMYESITLQLQLENDLRQAIEELDCD